jgi:Lhr-like helicase
VAQVAGLVFKGYPGSRKTSSQLQVSTSLLYDVFTKYEPDNLLLKQAEREVLQDQLETHRLAKTLSRLINAPLSGKRPVDLHPWRFLCWWSGSTPACPTKLSWNASSA